MATIKMRALSFVHFYYTCFSHVHYILTWRKANYANGFFLCFVKEIYYPNQFYILLFKQQEVSSSTFTYTKVSFYKQLTGISLFCCLELTERMKLRKRYDDWQKTFPSSFHKLKLSLRDNSTDRQQKKSESHISTYRMKMMMLILS